MKHHPPFDPSQAFGGQTWNATRGTWTSSSTAPDFDGETYEREKDHHRLTRQLDRVSAVLTDGCWHSLSDLSERTGDPEGSISARLRDLRKEKFGGHDVKRDRRGNTWFYRLEISRPVEADGQARLFR